MSDPNADANTDANADSIAYWLRELKQGDPRAIDQIWREYYEKLVRLVRRRIGGNSLRVVDEEDIALSALNSFYDGVQAGRFPQLDDRDNLWKILVVIACRKTSAQRDRQFAQRRGAGEARGESFFANPEVDEGGRGIEQVMGREPTPEVAATVAETFQELFAALPDDLQRAIATHKMDGFSNEEIAVKLGCSLRTVERKLEQIRDRWSRSN